MFALRCRFSSWRGAQETFVFATVIRFVFQAGKELIVKPVCLEKARQVLKVLVLCTSAQSDLLATGFYFGAL